MIETTDQATTDNGIALGVAEPTITGVPVSIAVGVASSTRDGLATDQTLRKPSHTAGQILDIMSLAFGVVAGFEQNGYADTTIVGVYPAHGSYAVITVATPLVTEPCI